MSEKREYALRITVNGTRYRRVIVDSHFERRHRESMNDSLILKLVRKLDGGAFLPEAKLANGYEIFVNDPWNLDGLAYRLIWTTHRSKDYIGVINAFRRRNGKEK